MRFLFLDVVANFGTHGPRDAHFHQCQRRGCEAILVGSGRVCGAHIFVHEVRE